MKRHIASYIMNPFRHHLVRGSILLLSLTAPSAISAEEREVSVTNPSDGVKLAATLSNPSGKPKAAILLATGSGPQNRDEEIMGLRPFKVLSDSLTAAGYAVLRMDDRGTGSSGGDFQTATAADFLSDLKSGIAFLDSCYTSLPKGIIGHSEGGQFAIRIAAETKATSTSSPDFIITLAAPAWRGDSLIMSQARALSTAMTGSWPMEGMQREILDIARGPLPVSIASPMLYGIFAKNLRSAAQMPQVQQQITAQVEAVLSPYYRELLRFDPESSIKSVTVPWLALNGDKDLQVVPENLDTIRQLNPKANAIRVKGHNHLFQEATTGLPQEYSGLGQSPSPETIAIIIRWLDQL